MNPTLATLRTTIKRATRFYIHADRDLCAPSYSDAANFVLTCVRSVRVNGKDHEIKSTVEIPGRITHGHTSKVEWHKGYDGRDFPVYSEPYRAEHGYESLSDEVFRSAVLSIPARCEPRFLVSLDGGTNEYQIKAGLHTDYVYLEAYDPGKSQTLRRFLIDASTGAHNSARFGSPKHELDSGSYETWRARNA